MADYLQNALKEHPRTRRLGELITDIAYPISSSLVGASYVPFGSHLLNGVNSLKQTSDYIFQSPYDRLLHQFEESRRLRESLESQIEVQSTQSGYENLKIGACPVCAEESESREEREAHIHQLRQTVDALNGRIEELVLLLQEKEVENITLRRQLIESVPMRPMIETKESAVLGEGNDRGMGILTPESVRGLSTPESMKGRELSRSEAKDEADEKDTSTLDHSQSQDDESQEQTPGEPVGLGFPEPELVGTEMVEMGGQKHEEVEQLGEEKVEAGEHEEPEESVELAERTEEHEEHEEQAEIGSIPEEEDSSSFPVPELTVPVPTSASLEESAVLVSHPDLSSVKTAVEPVPVPELASQPETEGEALTEETVGAIPPVQESPESQESKVISFPVPAPFPAHVASQIETASMEVIPPTSPPVPSIIEPKEDEGRTSPSPSSERRVRTTPPSAMPSIDLSGGLDRPISGYVVGTDDQIHPISYSKYEHGRSMSASGIPVHKDSSSTKGSSDHGHGSLGAFSSFGFSGPVPHRSPSPSSSPSKSPKGSKLDSIKKKKHHSFFGRHSSENTSQDAQDGTSTDKAKEDQNKDRPSTPGSESVHHKPSFRTRVFSTHGTGAHAQTHSGRGSETAASTHGGNGKNKSDDESSVKSGESKELSGGSRPGTPSKLGRNHSFFRDHVKVPLERKASQIAHKGRELFKHESESEHSHHHHHQSHSSS